MDAVRRGIARVPARLVDGSTALTCISHKAPARLLPLHTPAAARRGAARCVLSSLGGGLLQGDAIAVEARVGAGATLQLSTQASTKVYRGARGAAQSLDADVAAGGLLVVTPDAVTPFAGSRYEQKQTVKLAAGGSCVVVDWLGAGRSANGERWRSLACTSRTAYVTASRTLVDAVALPGAHAIDATDAWYDAVVSCVFAGPRARETGEKALAVARRLAAMRGARVADGAQADVGPLAGAVLMGAGRVDDDLVVARFCAEAPEDAYRILKEALAPLEAALGEAPYAERLHGVGGFGRRARVPAEDAVADVADASSTPMTPEHVLALSQLVDSALPTGAFAHSGGLEAAAQLGLLKPDDESSLVRFLGQLRASHYSLYVPFFDAAYRGEDLGALDAALDALLAPAPPAQRASLAQGAGLRRVAGALGGGVPEACAHGAVALGALAHSLNLPLAAARDAFAFAAVRDACSAAVRLGLCQPTRAVAVQREVLARPRPGVPAVEDAAAAAPAVDAAHCAHDLLEMRLFRS